MSCGNLPTGGCDNPDLTHEGPCTWDSETPEQQAKRARRNKRKTEKYRAKKRGCMKLRYRDSVSAKLALAKLQRQDKPHHTEARAYRCRTCQGWHLTSRKDV